MAQISHELGPAIILYDVEAEYQHPDLDLAYIDKVASEAADQLRYARNLDERQTPAGVEIAYQPGDGTFYGIVLVELFLLSGTSGRVKNGVQWESNAVRGVSMNSIGWYEPGSFLVSVIESGAYPLRLGDSDPVAGSYISEHWGLSRVSALSVAILLRAISWYLNPDV